MQCIPYPTIYVKMPLDLLVFRRTISNIRCQVSYLDNFSFQLHKSRVLNVFCKFCKSTQLRHNTRKICRSILDSYARSYGIKRRASQSFHTEAMLFYFAIHKELLNQSFVFSENLLDNHALLYGPTVSDRTSRYSG
jgi:hypothetical protein